MALYQTRQRDPMMDPNIQAVLERRARELIGLGLIALAGVFVVMLGSYAPEDPGWMVETGEPVRNWLGSPGAAIASTLVIITGRGAWALPLILSAWGLRFVLHRGAERALGRVVFALIAVAMASVFAATHVPGAGWPHSFGLGGLFGDTVLGALLGVAPVKAAFGLKVTSLLAGLALLAMLLFVTGFDLRELQAIRHFLALGSVMTYSQVMQWAGRGTSGAIEAARAMQDRRRLRRADVPLPVVPPQAVPRHRVIRAEPAEEAVVEDDGYMPDFGAPAELPGASARRTPPQSYAPPPMALPPPKRKEGFLGRLRRVVDPAPQPERPVASPLSEPAPVSEERIRARISDVIRSRAGQAGGQGAGSATLPNMTPLQAAIARREPALSRHGAASGVRMEPPVVAPVAAAPAMTNAVSAAVASVAARAAAARTRLAETTRPVAIPQPQMETACAAPPVPVAEPPVTASMLRPTTALPAAMALPPAEPPFSAPPVLEVRSAEAALRLDRPEPLMRPAATRLPAAAPMQPPVMEPGWNAPPGVSPVVPADAGWEIDDGFEPDHDPSPVVHRNASALFAPEVKRGVVQHPAKKLPAPSRQAVAEAQPRLQFEEAAQLRYELPPLSLLASASTVRRHALSDEALEENARMLEAVLDDYGVKGEIVSVRPGPVVTMYELEPAPGLKASRVIGLADDIARSMSALSARVSTVPGRSVIGIELPNVAREKVLLREILSAREFGDGNQRLPLALGKDIGGDPVVANLAKMPHLLIAGTTGSGKSVAINTMILSLLYKLTPEECRLIMIDPKMLELSVYDGIPHLLSPVVTDPKKAVVALKWVVGEMEERYRKMSKMGVRNIDGYNGRVHEALAVGELFRRTVQTGFDDDTGEPVFETEEFAPVSLPYIVVIVDEMADLMMVAGKEIEACIQRLAQMARASGIHLIMATQRPSVDVITGTIKANFPTRISFQVTSKIDSRTILGEQGAEQLLGQGDMLYMGNGARITRIHGPFVSDEEVEEIVNHLKSFGPPHYMSGVVEGPEDEMAGDIDAVLGLGGNSDGEDALYDQAVAIVAKDRKCSTSYIQRKLGIGYNKAARLVEQMEEEGVVTPANHVGKREILIPEA
ncbi:MAG: DNA translocase FtsK 4TM domain-containing protein [Gemmobacter sp.]|jgi:S-DNA-T family DNA segregation ATPase FtsK/SpoIIIE|nr:DNA translocase FtsK 4TM domain-containing protein [Gemmobacter sp.]